jgi:hypothetical protein
MGRDNALKRVYALGRLKAGVMNKTEAAYALHLEAMKQGGEILWYKFEGMKFRLADSTFYTPDFAVMRSDGVLEMHEVKGYMLEDANVKIKVASSMYPIRFLAIYARPKKEGGGWRVDEF